MAGPSWESMGGGKRAPAPALLWADGLRRVASLGHGQEVGDQTRRLLSSSASCNQCGCLLPVQVMVWIHGGALLLGGAATYDGLALSAHENVVVVTIQYRLGIWGFFR